MNIEVNFGINFRDIFRVFIPSAGKADTLLLHAIALAPSIYFWMIFLFI